MTPEQIRNQCEDDADRAPSNTTQWRDRGLIIAAQQTRIAQLEAQIARIEELAEDWLGYHPSVLVARGLAGVALRGALRKEPS